uniref:Neuropeptide-Like Protein n=1 Tax=Globodera pallida TaxID=36090 RepID=A0A183BMT4_GLOPA
MMRLSFPIFFLLILGCLLVIMPDISSSTRPNRHHKIALVRRDGDYDQLLSEFRSKGSRMRFGKRTMGPLTEAVAPPLIDVADMESDPNIYDD